MPNPLLEYYGKNIQQTISKHTHKDGKTWIHTDDLGYMDEDPFCCSF